MLQSNAAIISILERMCFMTYEFCILGLAILITFVKRNEAKKFISAFPPW